MRHIPLTQGQVTLVDDSAYEWLSKQKWCKGVYRRSDKRKWMSYLWLNGKQTFLGYFNLEADAARAYDVAALKHFREFALTNKMLGLL